MQKQQPNLSPITTTNNQTNMITTTVAQRATSMQRLLHRSAKPSSAGIILQQRGTTFQRVPPSAPKKQHRSKHVHLNYPSHVNPSELSATENKRIVKQVDKNWTALYSALGRTNPPTKKHELALPSYYECSGRRAIFDDWTQATIPSAPLAPPTLKGILKRKNAKASRQAKSASFGDTVFYMGYFGSKFDVYDCAICSQINFIPHLSRSFLIYSQL